MSVDERLRSSLKRQADSFHPPVETALAQTRSRGRAARWRTAAAAMAGSAAAAAAIAGIFAWVQTSGSENSQPAGKPSGTRSVVTPEAAPLRGPITADVTKPNRFAGRWVLTLNGNGTMDVQAPEGIPGLGSSALYTSDESTFRTTLFQGDACAGHGTGIYDWLQSGDVIGFDAVSDPCHARVRFFEESVWTVSTDADARG